MMRDGFIRISFKPRGSQAEALLANVVGWTQEKRDRTRSKSRLAQCGGRIQPRPALLSPPRCQVKPSMLGALLVAVSRLSAASMPLHKTRATHVCLFRLKNDQLPPALAKPTALYQQHQISQELPSPAPDHSGKGINFKPFPIKCWKSPCVLRHLKLFDILVAVESGDEDLEEGDTVKTKDPPSAGHKADHLQDSSSQGHS